jgi:hypothetical protein
MMKISFCLEFWLYAKQLTRESLKSNFNENFYCIIFLRLQKKKFLGIFFINCIRLRIQYRGKKKQA